jgi:hypothetical protein
MIADPKREPHQDDGDSDKRSRQEEALDEALKNTFPASDPVSVEQPTMSERAFRPRPLSFPKILSIRNRVVKQNQGIIRSDARSPPPDRHFRC